MRRLLNALLCHAIPPGSIAAVPYLPKRFMKESGGLTGLGRMMGRIVGKGRSGKS